MKKHNTNQMNAKQNVRPYKSIKLTAYGQMVKLTAAGSGGLGENANNANKKPIRL